MAERERVKQAIEAPVAEAAKLLDESRSSDVETRLVMLIDGWGRGLAAGIEELAIAVAELRRTSSVDEMPSPHPAAAKTSENNETSDEPRDHEQPRTEDELRADAARSREETAELREEGARH